MIFASTEEIRDTFISHDLKYGIEEREKSSILRVGINAKETTFEALFISHGDANDVIIRIPRLIKFPPEKEAAVIETINACNLTYRFFTLSVDTEDHSIYLQYDMLPGTENPGIVAYEMLVRVTGIIDQCYPVIMKKIYE